MDLWWNIITIVYLCVEWATMKEKWRNYKVLSEDWGIGKKRKERRKNGRKERKKEESKERKKKKSKISQGSGEIFELSKTFLLLL